MKQLDVDALVVGAGFGGIFQLYRLREAGLRVQVIDAAADVGGTWFWNRYPGAMSDTESYIYRFSWDKEDLQQYEWKEHYIKQPEVLAYLNHVVDRHDLRKHMLFNTEMRSADYDDARNVWRIETNTGDTFVARYLVTALGLLSKRNYPEIPGLNTFRGEMYHTGNWPKHHNFIGKRVAVIGCGSTGVQVITAIAKEVKQLICFQRHPQYSVPSGDGPVSKEYREQVNSNYDAIWDQVKNSIVAFGFKESTTATMSVSEDERQHIFEEYWNKGNGFRFMFGTFNDITFNEEANEAACTFLRRKIAEIVKDPEKRRKLTPHDFYARRPLCDGGYYEQFNRDSVDIVDIKETPITEITETGIRTSDGKLHVLDAIVFATGFDAVDGNYTRIAIRGRGGASLKERWSETGPTSYLGICVADFPNLFMITGPNGPFTNIPPTLETHVEFIADAIKHAEAEAQTQAQSTESQSNQSSPFSRIQIEAIQSAEDEWTSLCEQLCATSLFARTDSWIFGANVPGKKHAVRFFFGGLQNYRERLKAIVEDDYRGFKPFITEVGAQT